MGSFIYVGLIPGRGNCMFECTLQWKQSEHPETSYSVCCADRSPQFRRWKVTSTIFPLPGV